MNLQRPASRAVSPRWRTTLASALALAVLAACGGDNDSEPRPSAARPGNLLLVNGDTSVVNCTVATNGDLTSCEGAFIDGVDGPGSIELTRDRAYVSDLKNHAVSVCQLGARGALSQCDSTADNTFVAPYHMYVANTHLYAAQSDGTLAVCDVGAGVPTNCRVSNAGGLLRAPAAVAGHAGVLYIANQGDQSIVSCALDADALPSRCTRQAADGALDGPTGLAFEDGRLYVTNIGDESVTTCATAKDGALADCRKFSVEGAFTNPVDIALNGNRAYVANMSDHTVTVCDLDASGSLAQCEPMRAGALFLYPSGLAFAPSPF